jgi:hypothetical protein
MNEPAELLDYGWVDPPPAMPDIYKKSKNSIVCYRAYYKDGKTKLLTYTGRHKPHWLSSA